MCLVQCPIATSETGRDSDRCASRFVVTIDIVFRSAATYLKRHLAQRLSEQITATQISRSETRKNLRDY